MTNEDKASFLKQIGNPSKNTRGVLFTYKNPEDTVSTQHGVAFTSPQKRKEERKIPNKDNIGTGMKYGDREPSVLEHEGTHYLFNDLQNKYNLSNDHRKALQNKMLSFFTFQGY